MTVQSQKFVWAYMIENGRLTTGAWSYYAGDFEDAFDIAYDYRKRIASMDVVRTKVKEIGIDWDKTSIPESSMESSFEGTFSPSSISETLLGTLVLQDNSTYIIGVGNAETRFSDYLKTLNNLMEDTQRIKDILGE
jgi:hypothetical protein